VLLQAMDASNLSEPNSSFWYAFGSIAEQFGEREIALNYYARVIKPKHATQIPESSYALAQKRTKLLNSAGAQLSMRGSAGQAH
jgi:hypothetical protein